MYPAAWTRITLITLLLAPLSWLFRAVVATRRFLYQALPSLSQRLPVPVIVVGNISVGGTGKTPLVLWLVARLREADYQPGIVSRGYGGAHELAHAVHGDSDATRYGDEPVLLARRSACPVWIGKDRVAAARALLAASPHCNIIVADDGLQHYRLARTLEIAVIDGARGHGNGFMLPAGPLREPLARLNSVDAVVVRGAPSPQPSAPLQVCPCPRTRGEGASWNDADGRVSATALPPQFTMTLESTVLRNLRNSSRSPLGSLHGKRVHAVAGIGNPQQFFDALTQLGIAHTPHAFADHHPFSASDLKFENCDAVVMTEKDAVKCERYATDTHWVLEAEAKVDDALAQIVLDRIKRKH